MHWEQFSQEPLSTEEIVPVKNCWQHVFVDKCAVEFYVMFFNEIPFISRVLGRRQKCQIKPFFFVIQVNQSLTSSTRNITSYFNYFSSQTGRCLLSSAALWSSGCVNWLTKLSATRRDNISIITGCWRPNKTHDAGSVLFDRNLFGNLYNYKYTLLSTQAKDVHISNTTRLYIFIYLMWLHAVRDGSLL